MFQSALDLEPNQSPFPWQVEMLSRLSDCDDTRLSIDVPTGLGKTSVIAAWLVAKAKGANLPRRLVYVVDRRAVVDQATDEAMRLRRWLEHQPDAKSSLGLEQDQQLPISTLRGQFADNREWLSDPTLPTVVVGTVDMVGSRLLFEGYGVSRKMRPYHAGFLGTDTFFVLDEAHLVPPFEALLEAVVARSPVLHGEHRGGQTVPRSMMLSLSATGRSSSNALQIDERDLKHEIAGKRLNAVKRLTFWEPPKKEKDKEIGIPERLAADAWALSGEGTLPTRIIVFCNSRDGAIKAEKAVASLAKADKKNDIPKREIATQLFVGARRVRERQEVADWLFKYGFLTGNKVKPEVPSFVFATSAGEVGVDLDADHMASDLVPYERMVQRLGRVNRRGEGKAEVHVLLERDQPDKKEQTALTKALAKSSRVRNASDHKLVGQFDLAKRYRAALQQLPKLNDSAALDASPEALRQLKIRSTEDDKLRQILDDATTANPLRPELTRPILDAWSMTSLEEHFARPNVGPWLRGWVDDEPQTTVVWREYLPTRSERCTDKQISEFFDEAPIHLTEKLEGRSDAVFKWVTDRVATIWKARNDEKKTKAIAPKMFPKPNEVVALVLDPSGKPVARLTLNELHFETDKKAKIAKETFRRQLWSKTLVVDARLGGLSKGLLDSKAKEIEFATTIDGPGEWMPPNEDADPTTPPIPAFHVRELKAEQLQEQSNRKRTSEWRTCLRQPIVGKDEDEPSSFLIVKIFRHAVTSEDSRSTTSDLQLETHLQQTEDEIIRLAGRLDLSDDLTLVFRIAARNHDHGKNCDRWQNAFSAKEEGRPYAKTAGPFRSNYLEGYRHEFGSLPSVAKDADFDSLSEPLRDLCLHLVAAHHGFARPVIRVDGCDDAPPSALEDRARNVALRFARLQKQWGPWGLAWLESIMRAADQRASAAADVVEEIDANKNSGNIKAEVNHG